MLPSPELGVEREYREESELNATHPLVTGMQQASWNRTDDDPTLDTTDELPYDTVLLAASHVPDDEAHVRRLLAARVVGTVNGGPQQRRFRAGKAGDQQLVQFRECGGDCAVPCCA